LCHWFGIVGFNAKKDEIHGTHFIGIVGEESVAYMQVFLEALDGQTASSQRRQVEPPGNERDLVRVCDKPRPEITANGSCAHDSDAHQRSSLIIETL
jgi:hypothetical protein